MSDADKLKTSQIDGTYRNAALRQARWTIWLVVLSLVIFLVWAAVAQVDQITRGDGRVIPLSRMQTIQSLEGGILSELRVSEGDLVRKGDTIALLDPTKTRASFLAAATEIEALEAEVARLEAEVMEAAVLDFGPTPSETQKTELRLFEARHTRLQASLRALQGERAAIEEQLAITAPLAQSGAISRMDVLQLNQKLSELEGRISDARNGYVQDAYRDLAERRARIATLKEEIVQKEDQLSRTVVRSPVDGRINNITITTIGGVVQPGEPMMEITPIDDELLIEVKILPRDVAFIAPDMPASVKITAYDYAVYGDLRGQVTQISEDTVEEDSPNGKQEFYRVMVQTERAYLERFGETFPIRPGMVAQVDIESGRQSILSYLVRPLLRARLR